MVPPARVGRRRRPRVRVLLLPLGLALAGIALSSSAGGRSSDRRVLQQQGPAVTSCTARVDQTGVFTDPRDALEYTVFRLYVEVHDDALANVYALYGSEDSPLAIPPAFQVDPPFGADYGGVSPQLFGAEDTAQYDSWLTVGLADGNLHRELTVSDGFFGRSGAVQ